MTNTMDTDVDKDKGAAPTVPPVGSKESMARAFLQTTLGGRLLRLSLMYFTTRQPVSIKNVDELAKLVDDKAMAIVMNTFSAENLQALLSMRVELDWITRCDENMYLLLKEEASTAAPQGDVVKS